MSEAAAVSQARLLAAYQLRIELNTQLGETFDTRPENFNLLVKWSFMLLRAQDRVNAFRGVATVEEGLGILLQLNEEGSIDTVRHAISLVKKFINEVKTNSHVPGYSHYAVSTTEAHITALTMRKT